MPFAEINGQKIAYEDTETDGPAIVFMHGFLMDKSMFDPQVELLSKEYRCIRFDARTFGETVWDGKAFTLYDTVSDCIGLMDHLGIKHAVIAGMSQGGYAAQRLALKHPDRVDALLLMSTCGNVDPKEMLEMCGQMRDAWRSIGPIPDLVNELMTAIIGPEEGVSSFWKVWRPKWEARSGEEIFHAMNNLMERDDIEPLLGKITQPALVSHGEADQGVPIELGERLAAALPNSKPLIRLPNAAHAANLTHAELLNPHIKPFLASLQLSKVG